MLESEDFKMSREVLKSKRKELKSMGKGNRENRSEPLTAEEEETLWTKEVMGPTSPTTLLRAIWFLTTKHMGE